MEKITKEIELEEFSTEELSIEYLKLLKESQKAYQNSYAPYSNFPVGAAILLENGKVVIGANQENAAYPSGLCAERVALFSCAVNHPAEKIKAIAISVQKELDSYAFPCGSCLQVMSEYYQRQQQPFDIILGHPKTSKVLISRGLENLLPFGFKKENLA